MKYTKFLEYIKIQPVLVDIGASGYTPTIWNSIATHSTYIGFDPDQRDFSHVDNSKYKTHLIANEAVTSKFDGDTIKFYLTKSPYCSSVLEPNQIEVSNYSYASYFDIDGTAAVKASSLDNILNRMDISSIHWLKTDTQGTDLRIICSLSTEIRDHILVIDVEPGLINAYKDEDLFSETHSALISEGFWLSNAEVKGVSRISTSSIQRVSKINPSLVNLSSTRLRTSPGWCEARYLRTIDHLIKIDASREEFILLWIFSMMDSQYGFALDVLYALENKYGNDDMTSNMEKIAINKFYNINHTNIVNIIKHLMPVKYKNILKKILKLG